MKTTNKTKQADKSAPPPRSRLATRRAGSDAGTPPDPLRIAAGEAPHVAIHEQRGGLAAAPGSSQAQRTLLPL